MTRLYRYCSGCHGWQPFYRFFYRSASGSRHRWHRRCQVCKQSHRPSLPVPYAVPSSTPAGEPAGTNTPVASRRAEQH